MNVGSLFTGVGGFDLGLERAGMQVLWQCESDPYRRVSLTAAVFAQGWPVLAAMFLALTVLILLGTFAHRLWLLHLVPFVGAPKLAAEFELDGHEDLRLGLLHGEDRTALLLIRVRVPKHGDLGSAWINLLLPKGVREERVDAYGDPLPEGSWTQPVKHQLGAHTWADRWIVKDVRLGGDLAHEFWFKLRFRTPGIYEVLLKVGDSALYDEFTASASIHVEGVVGPPSRRDWLRHLVDEGDRLIEADPSETQVIGWLLRVRAAVPQSLLGLFDAEAPTTGESLGELMRRRVRSLRDVLRGAAE